MSDEIQPDPPAPRPRREERDEYDDERPRPRRRRRDEDDEDARFRNPDAIEALIPYKNPRALIAYYVGVFSLIPCLGLGLGPAAIVLGMLGLKYRKLHPTAGGTGHAIAGIVLGTLVLLGHLVVGVIIGVAIAKGP